MIARPSGQGPPLERTTARAAHLARRPQVALSGPFLGGLLADFLARRTVKGRPSTLLGDQALCACVCSAAATAVCLAARARAGFIRRARWRPTFATLDRRGRFGRRPSPSRRDLEL